MGLRGVQLLWKGPSNCWTVPIVASYPLSLGDLQPTCRLGPFRLQPLSDPALVPIPHWKEGSAGSTHPRLVASLGGTERLRVWACGVIWQSICLMTVD